MESGREAVEQSPARTLVDLISDHVARSRTLYAERLELVDRLRIEAESSSGASWWSPDDLAWRDLRAEVAAALEVHERSAQTQLDLARRLRHDFRPTFDGLHAARFSEQHARIVVEESAGLPADLLPEYESRLLPQATVLVASRFARLARQIRASLEPEASIARHRDALQERRVALEAAPDGMAWFGALLSAEDAIGASAAVTGLARGLLATGETRTLAQIEADVFRDLLVDASAVVPPADAGASPVPSPGSRRGLIAEVVVHVPVLTVIGRADDGGLLEGYGPIDADTARELCAGAPGFIRVLTDPADGATLSFGRSTYRVPAELKRLIRMRDEVCRFVGCTRAAALCDIDHTIPWSEHGETVEANLGTLCRGHHRLKERGRWKVERDPGAVYRWTSPTGRSYETRPAATGFPRIGAPPRAMTAWLSAPPF